MFKGMKPYFWWGMGAFYGYVFLMMFLEMSIPGLTYQFKLGNVPLSFLYNHLFGLYILPLAIAYMFWYIPEQEEKKRDAQAQGVEKSAS